MNLENEKSKEKNSRRLVDDGEAMTRSVVRNKTFL